MMGIDGKNNNTVQDVNKMHNDNVQNYNNVKGGVNSIYRWHYKFGKCRFRRSKH